AGNKVGECKVVEGSVVVENPLEPQPDMKTPYDPTKPEDTPKVTDNDKLGGKPVVPGDNVVIEDKTPENYQESPITITPDGKINVPEGTPSSEERRGGEICEIDGSGKKGCEYKLVAGSVVVENPLVPEEDYRTPYDPTKPEDTPKVTDNDKLGGKPVVPDENVVIEDKTPENHPESPITITPDGTINVPEGTPSGEYPFSYEICEIDADGNKVGECKVVEGSVVVENTLVPEEDYQIPYDPTKPEETPKVTDNDKLGGKPVVPGENVVIEDKTPDNHPESPITITPDGKINVPEGTPSGEYPFSYEICEIDAAGNKVGECKVVEGSVVVENPLEPQPDMQMPYDPTNPEETPKVTENDKLGGKPVVPGDNVVITDVPVEGSPVIVNSDGTITVAPNTPMGEYPFSYQICEISAEPANCKTVVGSVEV